MSCRTLSTPGCHHAASRAYLCTSDTPHRLRRSTWPLCCKRFSPRLLAAAWMLLPALHSTWSATCAFSMHHSNPFCSIPTWLATSDRSASASLLGSSRSVLIRRSAAFSVLFTWHGREATSSSHVFCAQHAQPAWTSPQLQLACSPARPVTAAAWMRLAAWPGPGHTAPAQRPAAAAASQPQQHPRRSLP